MKQALLVCCLLLVACGGGDGAALSEEAQAGQELFAERVLAGNPGCITCHSLESGRVLIGPSMVGVGSRAGDRQPGVAAADYLERSIVDPDSFVVEGFVSGAMPQDWGEVLTGAEIDALVSYLLELDS